MTYNARTRSFCALAAVAAVMLLPGCGGSSGADKTKTYKQDALKAANQFKTSAHAASQQVQSASGIAAKLKGLDALKASVSTAADDFAKLTPPSDKKAANGALVQNLRALAGDVNGIGQALRNNDASAAKSVLAKVQADQVKVDAAVTQLQSGGQ